MSEARLIQKLVHVLGRARADALIKATLDELGEKDLSTPEIRLAFGQGVLRHGGVIEAIGRSIKIQAILEGAKEPPPVAYPKTAAK